MTAREVAGAESHLNHLLDGDRALPGTRAAINLVLAELDRCRGQITEIYTITETHPDAPPGELLGEVRRLVDNDDHCMTAHQGPPSSLPAVLSSVEDVARVCEAAGLRREEPRPGDVGRWAPWAASTVSVVPSYGIMGVAVVALRGFGVTSIPHGAPTRMLWSAIQAARGGEPS